MGQLGIYYINLDDRIDRAENIQETLYDSGLLDRAQTSIERVSAVDTRRANRAALEALCGDQITSTSLAAIDRGYRQEHGELTSGSIGLYLSMLDTLRRFLASENECALIFEDDASLATGVTAKDVAAVIDKALEEQKQGSYDVLLLSHLFSGDTAHFLWMDVTRFMMLSAFMVTRAGAQKILAAALPMRQQLDWCLSDLSQMGQLHIQAVLPVLFVQQPFFIDGQWDSMQMDQPYRQT